MRLVYDLIRLALEQFNRTSISAKATDVEAFHRDLSRALRSAERLLPRERRVEADEV
jgi:hypothetical protein